MFSNSVTVLYYTANKEKPGFEEKIIANLKKQAGSLPIVSVSQKPLDLGHNICVGPQHPCYFNEFRQIRIGLDEVKTPFVLSAESDFLYPPEYFHLDPFIKRPTYRYKNVWVLNQTDSLFRFKRVSDGAQMVRVDVWKQSIDKSLAGQPEWVTSETDKGIARVQPDARSSWAWFGNPAITFKTQENIHQKTQLVRGFPPSGKLLYWGTVQKVKEEMFGDIADNS